MKFFSVALVVLGMSTVAQAQQNRGFELQDKAYQTYRLINDNAYRLSPEQSARVSQLLGDIQNEIYGQGGGFGERFMVNGNIENQEFRFEVRTLNDLNDQCGNFVRSKGLTSVDDIQVSVNLKPLQRLTTPGYWRSANVICGQIIKIARDNGLNRLGAGNVLVGAIENVDFKFVGNDRVDLYNQCDAFVKSKGLNAVDEIVVSRNFEAMKSLSTPGYWRTSLEICQQVMGIQ